MNACMCALVNNYLAKKPPQNVPQAWPSHGCLDRDHARQLSNWCDISKVAKVVHGNWSDYHCNRSDTLPSINTTTRALLLYWQIPCSLPHLEHTHTHTPIHTHACTHTHTHTHICMHARMHAHAHAHTHTLLYSLGEKDSVA